MHWCGWCGLIDGEFHGLICVTVAFGLQDVCNTNVCWFVFLLSFSCPLNCKYCHKLWRQLCICSLSQCVSCSSSKEQPPSKLTQPLVATAWGGKRGVCLHGCLDLNGNIYMPRGAEGFSWEGTEAQSCNEEDKMENLELGSRGSQRCITQGRW